MAFDARPAPKSEESLRECFETAMEVGSMNGAATFLGMEGTTFRRNMKRFLQRHATLEDWRRWDAFKASIPNLVRLNLDDGIPRPGQVANDASPVEEPVEDQPRIGGKIEHDEGDPIVRRHTFGIRRYILTVAQNNTHLHEALWRNILAFADFMGAEILVARCTYDIQNYRDEKRKKLAGQYNNPEDEGFWYPPEIEPYVIETGRRLKLAEDLIFVSDNLRPTLLDPLAARETYTGAASMILPHNQIAMRSVATMKHEATKFLYTTGTVSQRHYIHATEGNKASFHHGYGALLVEVDEASGAWWCRQINATDAGSFYDLDLFVEDGVVTESHQPEAVTWGDIHVAKLEPHVREAIWGVGGAVDQLRPRIQVFHDILDFHARSHHEMKDPFAMFKRWVEGRENVEDELRACAEFLSFAHRDSALSLVVNSNHDRHFERWLKEQDWKRDPINATVFLAAATAMLEAISEGHDDFLLLEWAMRRYGAPDAVKFLREDESYRICQHAGGIELALHGDRGPNGSKGSPASFKKLPFKANVGDKHAAGIWQGAYLSGVTGSLDMGYNVGPSNWSRSHVVTHPNGKRQIITMRDVAWRAA